MISITSKSPYAVLALAELGRSAGSDPVPIGELARRREVPVQFLDQLFAVLRRAGVISSQRGVKGGYRLRPRALRRDGAGDRRAARRPARPRRVRGVRDAAAAARKVLAETTIADVIERESREAGARMYHI